MVGRPLRAHHPLTFDDDAVPALVRVHLATQHTGPEPAPYIDVAGVEDDDASRDLHGGLRNW